MTEGNRILDKTFTNGNIKKVKYKDQNENTTKIERETINPFIHTINLDSYYDRFKIFFMGIFILPIKIILIFVCLILASICTHVGMIGMSKDDILVKPLEGWRRKAKDAVCWWVRMMYGVYGFPRVTVKGEQASAKDAPMLVVAPHSSCFDALPVVAAGAPSIVAKAQSKGVPFFAKYIDFTQPVYVHRDDSNSRHSTIEQIKERATSELNWPQILIFPEGTCTNRRCLITFKPGAFYPGVPVQPLVIRYPNKFDCITWTWNGPSAIKVLLLTMCQLYNRCELEYLPVYYPSPEEIADPNLYATNVRKVMADALGLPVEDFTYNDGRLTEKAMEIGLDSNTGLVHFSEIRKKYPNLTMRETEGPLLSAFASLLDSDKQEKAGPSLIRPADLATGVGIAPESPVLEKLFRYYDLDNKGYITFRDFIILHCEVVNGNGEIAQRLGADALRSVVSKALSAPEGETNLTEKLSNLLHRCFPLLDEDRVTLFLDQARASQEDGSLTQDGVVAAFEHFRELGFALCLSRDTAESEFKADSNSPSKKVTSSLTEEIECAPILRQRL